VSSVISDEEEIKKRSGEGPSKEKRGVTNLSLFKYPTQVPVLLRGLGMHVKKEEETTVRDSAELETVCWTILFMFLSWWPPISRSISWTSSPSPSSVYHDGLVHGAHTCIGSESVFQRALY
jgi:hypothetical protein